MNERSADHFYWWVGKEMFTRTKGGRRRESVYRSYATRAAAEAALVAAWRKLEEDGEPRP